MKPVAEANLFKAVTTVMSTQIVGIEPREKEAHPQETILEIITVDEIQEPTIEVLVAEDIKLNQDVVRLMLVDSKFTPVFANNGLEAVNMFKDEPDRFALVIMDVSMPIMDGYQATVQINTFNETNSRRHTPIIALTGHALKYDRQNCLDVGMDDYLVKPIRQFKLLEIMEKHYPSEPALSKMSA